MQLKISILAAISLSIMLLGLVACKNPGSDPSPAGYSGALVATGTSQVFHNVIVDTTYRTLANFTATPGSGIAAFVDSVTVNGIPMVLASDSLTYVVNGFHNTPNFSTGANWYVKGANGITSFNYNDSSFPSYNANALPDTLYRSTGYTFPFNNTVAPSADSLVVDLDTNRSANMSNGHLLLTINGLTVTPALLNVVQGDSMIIAVNAIAHSDQTFSSQRFAFLKIHTYFKTVFLK